MVYNPVGVAEATDIVIVEFPVPGADIEFGLKFTVTPAGIPDAENVIELLNPFTAVVVSVEDPWPPGVTLTPEGEADRVKVGAPFARVVALITLLYWLRLPAASVARTRYWYVELAANPVSVYVVPVATAILKKRVHPAPEHRSIK
jgi:hypothetical protein